MPNHAYFLAQASFGFSRKIELDKDRIVIGRTPGADIVIDEPRAPVVMGLVIQSEGEHYAVAHSDQHPFTINGDKVSSKKLCDGDTLFFDDFEMVFFVADPTAPLANPPLTRFDSNPWSLFRPASVSAPSSVHGQLLPDLMSMERTPNELAAKPNIASSRSSTSIPSPPALLSTWNTNTWGKLIAMQGSPLPNVELTASLAFLDFSNGRATLSRRNGQCYATLVSGVVFCSKEKLGTKPKVLFDNDLIASGQSVYRLRLGPGHCPD